MADRDCRTYLGAILFLDVVGFSKLPNSDQVALKALFNSLLLKSVASVPHEDYVLLDTGDGAVVCFHDRPELALLTAVVARDAWRAQAPVGLRMGLHLGPVQEVRDMNGNRNVIGDGINTAQRIISFAHSGEITASGQYRDAVCHVYGQMEQMFGEPATRADKHNRMHVVCAINTTKEQVLWAEQKLRSLFPDASPGSDPSRYKASVPGGNIDARARDSRSGSLPKRIALLAGIAGIAAATVSFLGSRPPADSATGAAPGPAEAAKSSPMAGGVPAAATPAQRAAPTADVADAVGNQKSGIPLGTPISDPTPATIAASRQEQAPLVPAAEAVPLTHRSVSTTAPAMRGAPTSAPRAQTPSHQSPRCSNLLQKMSVGEPLSESELREFKAQCQ